MALGVDGIIFDELTSDPGAPVEGQVWYNTTDDRLKIYRNGSVEVLIDKDELDNHVNSTSNPHTVTLEQARTGGNQLAGNIDMNNAGTIINVPDPTADHHVANQGWTNDQIRQRLAGLDWQESVLDKDLAVPPGSPSVNDRYIVGAHTYAIVAVNTTTEVFSIAGDHSTELSATETFDVVGSTGNDATWTVQSITYNAPNTEITVTGDITDATADGSIVFAEDAWNGKVDQIADWNGTSWDFAVPNEGYATRVEDENVIYIHDGTSWGTLGSAIDHGNLLGLGDDDHTQYLLVSGTRAMTGGLNMGGQAITNVGNVDGVDVSAHASRHIQGGGDEIDGDKIDIDFTPSNYVPDISPSEVTDLDHLTAHLKGIDTAVGGIGGSLRHKAGRVLAASFAGTPKAATVSFTTAFADASYAVTATAVTTSNKAFAPVVQNQTASGFDIMLGSNSTANLTQVNWVAVKDGESS